MMQVTMQLHIPMDHEHMTVYVSHYVNGQYITMTFFDLKKNKWELKALAKSFIFKKCENFFEAKKAKDYDLTLKATKNDETQ